MCNVDSLNIPGISHSIFLVCGRRWVTGAEESETAGEGGGPRTAHRRVQLQPCRFPFIVKLSFFFFLLTHFCTTDNRIQNEVLISVLSLLTA